MTSAVPSLVWFCGVCVIPPSEDDVPTGTAQAARVVGGVTLFSCLFCFSRNEPLAGIRLFDKPVLWNSPLVSRPPRVSPAEVGPRRVAKERHLPQGHSAGPGVGQSNASPPHGTAATAGGLPPGTNRIRHLFRSLSPFPLLGLARCPPGRPSQRSRRCAGRKKLRPQRLLLLPPPATPCNATGI